MSQEEPLRLAACQWFAGLPEGVLRDLEDRCRPLDLAPGELAITGDSPSEHGVYVVVQGRVEVFRATNPAGDVFLAELGAGACFGEFSVLTGRGGSARVRAGEATRLLEIPSDAFLRLIRDHPDLVLRLARHLVEIVRALDERVTALEGVGEDVRQLHRRMLLLTI